MLHREHGREFQIILVHALLSLKNGANIFLKYSNMAQDKSSNVQLHIVFHQYEALRVLLTNTPDIETPMILDKMWVWSYNQYYPSW